MSECGAEFTLATDLGAAEEVDDRGREETRPPPCSPDWLTADAAVEEVIAPESAAEDFVSAVEEVPACACAALEDAGGTPDVPAVEFAAPPVPAVEEAVEDVTTSDCPADDLGRTITSASLSAAALADASPGVWAATGSELRQSVTMRSARRRIAAEYSKMDILALIKFS